MVEESRLVIPYAPRSQFQSLHNRHQRWSIAVCHRRAGKTVAFINDLIRDAIRCEKPEPRFAYAAPFYAQAKDVAWQYLRKFAGVIPGAEFNEAELRCDFAHNKARIRLYGLDNYDRMRGTYLDGIVLDEYGDADPRAWAEVIRPALADRAGWAGFIGTPKGSNHFYDIWKASENDPDWFRLMLKASETGLIPAEELADAAKMMTEDQYEQEFECSFLAAVVGAYYSREMARAEADGRIRTVTYDPLVPVHTAWDLGISDSTSIWFCQVVGGEYRLIDYLENSGVGLDWYVNALRSKPYVWGEHYLPHDAAARELGTGRSRVETLNSLGLGSCKVLPQQSAADGINAARLVMQRCWFDKEKCDRGIESLRNYRREWDDKRKVFHDRPLHDWTSHAADAFRYLAMGLPRDEALEDRYVDRYRRKGSRHKHGWMAA
jgi:hypothetical protein